ncbi:hypothetical protein DL767_005310 [Monosporascus sp. MG133]|nr:hypothetical protein DL767_005310 [Monosporascus sp. MG133]
MAGSVSAWKGFSKEHRVGDAMMKHNEDKLKEAFGDMRLDDEDDDDDNFVPALDHPLRLYDADGVLHYAFYLWERHGQAHLLLPGDEDDRQYDESGQVKRPTYKTAQYQARDEINWRRWPRETALITNRLPGEFGIKLFSRTRPPPEWYKLYTGSKSDTFWKRKYKHEYAYRNPGSLGYTLFHRVWAQAPTRYVAWKFYGTY